MFVPGQVFSDGDSQVLSGINYFQGVAIKTIHRDYNVTSTRSDSDVSTLGMIETNLPSFFPLFKCSKVFLKELSIIIFS